MLELIGNPSWCCTGCVHPSTLSFTPPYTFTSLSSFFITLLPPAWSLSRVPWIRLRTVPNAVSTAIAQILGILLVVDSGKKKPRDFLDTIGISRNTWKREGDKANQWWCVVRTVFTLAPSSWAACKTCSGHTGSTAAASPVSSSIILVAASQNKGPGKFNPCTSKI